MSIKNIVHPANGIFMWRENTVYVQRKLECPADEKKSSN